MPRTQEASAESNENVPFDPDAEQVAAYIADMLVELSKLAVQRNMEALAIALDDAQIAAAAARRRAKAAR